MKFVITSVELDGYAGLGDPYVVTVEGLTTARDELADWLISRQFGIDPEQYDYELSRVISWQGEDIRVSTDDGPYIMCREA